jgi:hypothetical protein
MITPYRSRLRHRRRSWMDYSRAERSTTHSQTQSAQPTESCRASRPTPLMAMQRSNSAASAVLSPALHDSAPQDMEIGIIHTSTDEIPHVAPAPGLPSDLVSFFYSSIPSCASLWGINNGMDMHTGMEAFSDTLLTPLWQRPPQATPTQISDTPILPDYPSSKGPRAVYRRLPSKVLHDNPSMTRPNPTRRSMHRGRGVSSCLIAS